MIFIGIGLSGLMHLELALMILAVYFMLTINVSINAHLKKEFRLTYARLGPTEFRILAIIANTLLVLIHPLTYFHLNLYIGGHHLVLKSLDLVGLLVFIVLMVIYLSTIIKDGREYAEMDPMPDK
jgi:hypothetical protein